MLVYNQSHLLPECMHEHSKSVLVGSGNNLQMFYFDFTSTGYLYCNVPGFVYQVRRNGWGECVPVVRDFELTVSPLLPSETQFLTALCRFPTVLTGLQQ